MTGIIRALRSGDWLTRGRIRRIAFAVLAASAFGVAWLLATSDGRNDYQGRPLGTDFSNVYAAGTYVLEGRAGAPFDPVQQHARERELFGEATPFYGWHYPPFFLFIAALLALMPYGLALLVWQAVTFGLYLAAIRAVLAPAGSAPDSVGRAGAYDAPDRLWVLLAAAFPAVFVNIGHGHNGFLTAALLAGALVWLDARPALSGVLFGLLAYKPQFGILIPFALLAAGRWRALMAAGATVVILLAAATLAFGPDVWSAFLHSTRFTREVVLEQGDTGWHKIQSVFSWVRMWGGSVPLAYAVQGTTTSALIVAVVWLWRSPAAYPLKAAALCLGAVLATPYSLDYDLMAVAPALAFLAAHGLATGFSAHEKTALALLWIAPLVARSIAQQALVPLGVLSMGAVLVIVLKKAYGAAEVRRAVAGNTAPLRGAAAQFAAKQ